MGFGDDLEVSVVEGKSLHKVQLPDVWLGHGSRSQTFCCL